MFSFPFFAPMEKISSKQRWLKKRNTEPGLHESKPKALAKRLLNAQPDANFNMCNLRMSSYVKTVTYMYHVDVDEHEDVKSGL